MKENVLPGD